MASKSGSGDPKAADKGGRSGHKETLLEEIFNAATHGVGAGLAIAALVVMVVLAAMEDRARAVVTVAVYGTTLIIVFLSSTLYHGIPHRKTKRVLLAFDHCAIFLLIAGTYTPVALLALPGWKGWTLFGVVWGIALTGVLLRLIWLRNMHWIFILMYVAMGWLGFIFGAPLVEGLGADGMNLILIGGLFYTGGLLFYAWRRLPFNHAVWHLCVLAGSVFHFFAVAYYAIPSTA